MAKNSYATEIFVLFLLLLFAGIVLENTKPPDTTFKCDCDRKFSEATRNSSAYMTCLKECYNRFIKDTVKP